MERYEIKWTSRAKKDLRKAYLFNCDLVGEDKAFELIIQILARVDILSDSDYFGYFYATAPSSA